LPAHPGFVRARLAGACGLSVALAVPLLARGRVRAVAVFFATAPRPYDAAAVASVHAIAGVLGNALSEAQLPS